MKFFNTAGPCDPARHYMIPATERLAGENLMRLIEQQSYFVLHAPRQVGKTTAMTELARQLTETGRYAAALVSMEVGRGLPNDLGAAERAVIEDWWDDLRFQLPPDLQPPEPPNLGDSGEGRQIGSALRDWAEWSPRAVVAFLDEIDALEDDALISVLRQLRSGYRRRPQAFPASLAVIGLRDVRDYKVLSGGSTRLGTPSPFNIAIRSLTLRNFTAEETTRLLTQHTTETGQAFTDDALALVFTMTDGQPWLANALAKVCVEELEQDTTRAITPAHVEQAREILIERRQTHLGQLTDKLREERVWRVIEPILAGTMLDAVPEQELSR